MLCVLAVHCVCGSDARVCDTQSIRGCVQLSISVATGHFLVCVQSLNERTGRSMIVLLLGSARGRAGKTDSSRLTTRGLEIGPAIMNYRHHPPLIVLIAAVCCFEPDARGQDVRTQVPDRTSPILVAQTVVVPDGTPVFLRFAQPVYGLAVAPEKTAIKKGAAIRLVAAGDVRANGRIVITKGSVAQAMVTNVRRLVGSDLVFTGLTLRLDWVTTVTGARAPLRPRRTGTAESFEAEVFSDKGGIEVIPHSFKRGMANALIGLDLFTTRTFREKMWIPAGSRMHAFLDGDVTIGLAELEQAQAGLPTPNLTATLYVFRTKERGGLSPPVFCDQNEVGPLGSRQSAIVDLEPGKHSCHAGMSRPIELTVEGGNDYFLRLRSGMSNNWELKPVSTAEGEDRTADSELLPPRIAAESPHE